MEYTLRINNLRKSLSETDIDTICIHGDGKNAVKIAKTLKNALINKGIDFKPLNKLRKFT